MKKYMGLIMMAAGSLALSGIAQAGSTQPAPVQVDLAGFAAGDMITAREAKDKEVFIGCGTRNFEDGVGGLFSWAFCQAKDDEGEQVTCLTFNPDLVETVRAISGESYITFRFEDDGNGGFTCTGMGFSTQSFYLGKNIKGNQKGKDR